MPTLDMIQQAVHSAAEQYPVKRVELFGSYADGTADESSDVDFLVEFAENPTSLLHICGFRETLSELLNLDVDVVKLPRKQDDGLTIGRTVHIYMEHEVRNERIRLKMLDEIADIESFIVGHPLVDLLNNRMCQKAIVMSLINIGELSKSFTENYLTAMPEIPWKAIRGFRNIAAHQYGNIDFEDVYKTVTEDIPLLKATPIRRSDEN